MIITEQKLRKIIKKLISENYEEHEYYSTGSMPEEAYQNEYQEDSEFDQYNNIIPKEKYPGYTKVKNPMTGETEWYDEVVDETISNEELMQRIKDKKEIELYNLTRK